MKDTECGACIGAWNLGACKVGDFVQRGGPGVSRNTTYTGGILATPGERRSVQCSRKQGTGVRVC
jgi:hypothetical protein